MGIKSHYLHIHLDEFPDNLVHAMAILNYHQDKIERIYTSASVYLV